MITYNTPSSKHFYFGQASKPFKVSDNTYQIKCLWREHETGKYFDIVYLQFEVRSTEQLERLNLFNTDFIKYSYVEICSNQTPPVLKATGKFTDPKIVYPTEYERPKLQTAWNKLKNMAHQKKVMKFRE